MCDYVGVLFVCLCVSVSQHMCMVVCCGCQCLVECVSPNICLSQMSLRVSGSGVYVKVCGTWLLVPRLVVRWVYMSVCVGPVCVCVSVFVSRLSVYFCVCS